MDKPNHALLLYDEAIEIDIVNRFIPHTYIQHHNYTDNYMGCYEVILMFTGNDGDYLMSRLSRTGKLVTNMAMDCKYKQSQYGGLTIVTNTVDSILDLYGERDEVEEQSENEERDEVEEQSENEEIVYEDDIYKLLYGNSTEMLDFIDNGFD
jgi:phosphopantothenate synthetase